MYTPKVKSSRQQAKEKAKALKELYFLIEWEDRDSEDGHNLLDVLPAKAIVVDSDADVQLLCVGDKCQALFNKKVYPATIVGSGTYQEMKSTQEEMDTSGQLFSSDVFEIAEDDMDITEAAVPEDDVDISEAQLDDSKDDASGKVARSIGTPKRGAVKKGRPKAAKSPKPVKSPKGAKSPKRAPKSPKKKKTTRKVLTKSPTKKKPKREMGTEKARSMESDRISSLILASVGDFSETKGKKNISVPSQDEAGPSTAESPSTVVKSPSSSSTPIAPSTILGSSPPSADCSEHELDSDSFSYSGSYYDYENPAASPPAAKRVQYTPPSYGPPSTAPYPGMYPPYQQPPYPQQPPYMLSHSHSWPSSSQGVAAQMAEMKSLLVSSLGDMKMEILNLKSDVYAKKKRKRSREHSLASSDVSDQEVAPTPKGGLILGDPNGQFIHIDHPTVKASDIRGVEVLSKAASKCALALLDVFFSKECLARSLATKKEGKDLLDPDIIEGIRLHINYKYPCTTPEEERERWR